jgi:hypothetical protein
MNEATAGIDTRGNACGGTGSKSSPVSGAVISRQTCGVSSMSRV